MILKLLTGGYSGTEILLYASLMIFAIVISFSFHEFAHAFVAYKLGDNTPYNMGRVTLNPLAHIDPMGAVLLLLLGFGWGKPVRFNPSNISRLKNRRLGCILVYVAGVTANFIIALIATILSSLILGICGLRITSSGALIGLEILLQCISEFSIALLAFNLIPIPPLDGFNIVQELLPFNIKYSDGYRKFVSNAPMIFLVLIVAGNFLGISFFSWIMSIIEIPFVFVINLVSRGILMLF